MPDILVRPATPNDIPAIAGIYGQAVREGTASFEIDIPGRGGDDAAVRKLGGSGLSVPRGGP